jgi:cation transport ATPase
LFVTASYSCFQACVCWRSRIASAAALVSAVVQAASDGRMGTGHEALHGTAVGHTFAESGAMIVAFVLLGRALEERAKHAAGDAMRRHLATMSNLAAEEGLTQDNVARLLHEP